MIHQRRAGVKYGVKYDAHLYKERHLVECFINKIKWFRRISSRFDKLASRFLGFLASVGALIWLRGLCGLSSSPAMHTFSFRSEKYDALQISLIISGGRQYFISQQNQSWDAPPGGLPSIHQQCYTLIRNDADGLSASY